MSTPPTPTGFKDEQAAAVVEEGEPGEETEVVTIPLEKIAKVSASLVLVGLTSPVVIKVLSELDLF